MARPRSPAGQSRQDAGTPRPGGAAADEARAAGGPAGAAGGPRVPGPEAAARGGETPPGPGPARASPGSTPADGAGGPVAPEGPALRSYQELWFNLAKRPWMSIVLVPASPGGSTEELAAALADVGEHLSAGPVRAIKVSSLEYGSALALAELQQQVRQVASAAAAERANVIDVSLTEIGLADGKSNASEAISAVDPEETAITVSPGAPAQAARFIIAIPPLVAEPLGLAAAQHADLVVIAVELGASRIADARRTIELVGRERIAGCFLLR